uniref:Mitochondrial calcium uptake family, member 3b n=1 Tax=Acanthochromis polyacanthus TaxID=80966 RepID=A0A3Q1GLN0_9TELE
MAALRRLFPSLSSGSRSGTFSKQTTSRLVAAGACVTAAAGAAAAAAFYYRGRPGIRSHVEARLVHLALPAVSATEKTRSFGLDDGDVYMSSYENRFRLFSSVECDGQLYMTPLNFIESVTLNEPKSRRVWKSLTKKELDKMLADTPPVWKGSSNLFRNLRERGVISYTEYLFLLCILTKPHAGFRIAFNMFDADGNEMVDKREFLVLEEIFRKKKDRKEVAEDMQRLDQQSLQLYGHHTPQPHSNVDEKTETTLLVHFFGKKGKAELKFEDFYKFMDNLQTEVLEIEFLSYSKGMPTISEEDFARILLRYTNVDDVTGYLENVRHSIPDEKVCFSLQIHLVVGCGSASCHSE